MQKLWQTNFERLQKLVDECLDCELFIKACEHSIIKETYKTQTAVQENNNTAIVLNALNIARRSNRIIQVATQEAENSEDNAYVDRILGSNELLKQGISLILNSIKWSCSYKLLFKALPPMIQSAKILASQPNNKENYLLWANANEKVKFNFF